MKRFLCAVGAILLLMACHDGSTLIADDETVSSAAQLVGRWRALDSTEMRAFLGDGTTSIETPQSGVVPSTLRKEGTYRLVSSGKIEIRLKGEAPREWAVSFTGGKTRILRLKGPDGRTQGYVDASTVPAYAPTTFGGGSKR